MLELLRSIGRILRWPPGVFIGNLLGMLIESCVRLAFAELWSGVTKEGVSYCCIVATENLS